MSRTVFIIPYFGKLPSFFPYFLDSCKGNKDFNFLIFTDLEIERTPANVKVVSLSAEGFNTLASQKLGLEIQLTRFYKLCDFKVAYGKIFEDYIKDYEFWGSCDFDLVLGDLGNFITPTVLDTCDVYSGIQWYLSGSLFLFRNTENLNTLFSKSKDYPGLFLTDEFFGFDECGLVWHELAEGKDLFQLNAKVESITHLLFQLQRKGRVRLHFASHILETVGNGRVYIRDGRVYMGQKEYLLIHFIYLKTTYYFIVPTWRSIPSQYFIDKQGMHTMSQEAAWNYYVAGNMYSIIAKKLSNIAKRLTKFDFVPSKWKNQRKGLR